MICKREWDLCDMQMVKGFVVICNGIGICNRMLWGTSERSERWAEDALQPFTRDVSNAVIIEY